VNRRTFLKTGAVAPAFLRNLSGAAPDRPNILLLMSDQHRGDCLGSDGNSVIRTPNLDRLGAGGVRFRCACSSTPTAHRRAPRF
jgi:hypothetical protein